jgi:hypothetical protein
LACRHSADIAVRKKVIGIKLESGGWVHPSKKPELASRVRRPITWLPLGAKESLVLNASSEFSTWIIIWMIVYAPSNYRNHLPSRNKKVRKSCALMLTVSKSVVCIIKPENACWSIVKVVEGQALNTARCHFGCRSHPALSSSASLSAWFL